MPRIRDEPATQENYEEWLGRLEEEEALPDDYKTFQAMLRGELDMPDGSRMNYNDTQIDKLWEIKGVEKDYAEMGIKALGVREVWGWHQRYAIQGLQGLFGWESVQKVIAGERE